MNWPEVLEARSSAAISAYIDAHPEYSVDAPQPQYRGGTNRITMAHRGRERVVFKYLDASDRFQNELFCLKHFANTGLVPRVLDIHDGKLIVMSRLPSDDIPLAQFDPSVRTRISGEIGAALARLARVPLHQPATGYWPVTDYQSILWAATPRESVALYLERSKRIHAGVPEFGTPLFGASVRLIEEQLETIAAQDVILWHEDLGNLSVSDSHFVGFYDLEMCRGGTEAMQLGVALGLCLAVNFDWPMMLRAYEGAMGRTLKPHALLAVLAMQHFYHWIRVSRWGRWNGDPAETGLCQEAVADWNFYEEQLRQSSRELQRVAELPAYLAAVL